MALAFDSVEAKTEPGSGYTSASQTLTNTAGTALFAWLQTQDATSDASGTWAGAALTLMDSVSNAPSLYVFRLPTTPATGAQTLAMSWTGATRATIGIITFTGGGIPVAQTANKGSVGAGTTNFSTTLTLAATDIMVGFASYSSGVANLAVVTGTQRDEEETGDSASSSGVATNTGSGSTSITWSRGASAAACYIGVVVVEPVNVTPTISVINLASSVQAPTVTGGATVSPAVISMTAAVQAPTVTTPDPDWTNPSKNSASFSNTSKNSASWSNPSKNSSTWSNPSKS